MGLERIAAVLQGVHSNYEIDLFQDLIKAAARETGTEYLSSNSLKVIADHIRACSFLIVDGVIPGNEGRGYVLRRIIRRAIRHGYKLGQKHPFFHRLVDDLARRWAAPIRSCRSNAERVRSVLKTEEDRFADTLENGMKVLEGALTREDKLLDGETVFQLYDTFGFPVDLTADIARERGVRIDYAGFEAAMERQRERARAASKFRVGSGVEYSGGPTEFHGYDTLTLEGTVQALYVEGAPVAGDRRRRRRGRGARPHAVLRRVGRPGGRPRRARRRERHASCVEDTQKIQPEVFGHKGALKTGKLRVGDHVMAAVDGAARARDDVEPLRHAPHARGAAAVLGPHVQQKGSLVDADKHAVRLLAQRADDRRRRSARSRRS